MDSLDIVVKAIQTLDEKKARKIELLDIQGVTLIADYFIICEGGSTTQTKALADEVEDKLSELGVEPLHKEGVTTATWILMDYGSVIIHIFHPEARGFYNLERLWSDAVSLDINQFVKGQDQ